jgi:hypothetical protein
MRGHGGAWPDQRWHRRLVAVIALLECLVPLCTRPVDSWDDAEAAFGEVYADPVVVNGTAMTVAQLIERARRLQQAFDQLNMHILDTCRRPTGSSLPS